MTSRATRSDLNQALAKALAFRDCGETAKAAAWAAELVRMLEVPEGALAMKRRSRIDTLPPSPPCYLGFGTVRECFNLCRGQCGYKPAEPIAASTPTKPAVSSSGAQLG